MIFSKIYLLLGTNIITWFLKCLDHCVCVLVGIYWGTNSKLLTVTEKMMRCASANCFTSRYLGRKLFLQNLGNISFFAILFLSYYCHHIAHWAKKIISYWWNKQITTHFVGGMLLFNFIFWFFKTHLLFFTY